MLKNLNHHQLLSKRNAQSEPISFERGEGEVRKPNFRNRRIATIPRIFFSLARPHIFSIFKKKKAGSSYESTRFWGKSPTKRIPTLFQHLHTLNYTRFLNLRRLGKSFLLQNFCTGILCFQELRLITKRSMWIVCICSRKHSLKRNLRLLAAFSQKIKDDWSSIKK